MTTWITEIFQRSDQWIGGPWAVKEKFSGRTKGLLIENGIEYKIDDKGNRSKL